MDTNEDGDHELGRKLTEASVPFIVCPHCSVINVIPTEWCDWRCCICHKPVWPERQVEE